jgi:hypothetical protein
MERQLRGSRFSREVAPRISCSTLLMPVRVHRVVSALLGKLGTPAKPPKSCGRSPGRAKGRRSGRAELYPAIKKSP